MGLRHGVGESKPMGSGPQSRELTTVADRGNAGMVILHPSGCRIPSEDARTEVGACDQPLIHVVSVDQELAQ
jgi:hypothetical protein